MQTVIYHNKTIYNLDFCERIYVKGKDVVLVYPYSGDKGGVHKQHLVFDTQQQANLFFDDLCEGADTEVNNVKQKET